jgi:hypothetical protein
MKKLLGIAAVAVLAISSAPAFAQNASGTVNVGGVVASSCAWSNGMNTTSVNVNINNLVYPSNFQVNPTGTPLSNIGTVSCTGPAYIRVTSQYGGLKNGSVGSPVCQAGGSNTCVNYMFTAAIAGGPSATLTTNGTGGATIVSPTSTGSSITNTAVTMQLQPIVPTNNPALTAGTYSDVTTVAVGNPI